MDSKYEIFGSVFHLAQKWQSIADIELSAKANLTVRQWMLIVVIQKFFSDYPPTIAQAAEAYGSSRQNVKKIALELQKKKFMLITIDPHDKRIQRLALTGKHDQYFIGEDNLKWQNDFVARFLNVLNEDEIYKLNGIMRKLVIRSEEISKQLKQ
jgi:DNA-binding MarR family transcriptional regulator